MGLSTPKDDLLSYRLTWVDQLPFPLRDTIRRWREMIGMVLGVGIALGIGMTMLGVSSASVDAFTADYHRSSADLYVTTQGGKLIAFLPGDSPGFIKQARQALSQIRALPGVNAGIGIIPWSLERDQGGPRRRDEPTEIVASVGVDGDPTAIRGAVVMEQGRWLRRTNEVVLGPKLSREKQLGVGDSVRLNNRDFTVAGVGKLRGAGFNADSVAYLDRQSLRQRASLGDSLSFIIVDTDRPEATRQAIHDLDSYTIRNPAELVLDAEAANSTGVVLRWILVGLTLLIAAIFVSSMLSHSVAERRLEFATLRAIGVPERQVLLTIAAQATTISVAAWLVGLVVSSLLGALINGWIAPQYGIESLYAADAKLLALVFVLAGSVGIVSGLRPARQATRIDPVIVLREA